MASDSNASTTELSIDLICSPENNDPTGVGKKLEEDNARIALLNYLENATRDSKDPKHIFGFTLGLDKLKEFIESIDKYNSKGDLAQNDKVAGVRIYYAKTIRSTPVPPLIRGVMYPDLILVPVLPSGEDFHTQIRSDKDKATDPTILGELRPCPNECKLKFLEKKKRK